MKIAKKEKRDSAKKLAHISCRQRRLQKAIEESQFKFYGSFVPVYGPFAWSPDSELCKMRTSDSVCQK